MTNIMKKLLPVYIIEFWERFSFYGFQAIFIIYLIQGLNFQDKIAINLFASFSALIFASMSIGGYIGDKVLGAKRTTFLGAIVLAVGYAILAFNPNVLLYYGLATIITGNMLFKANPPILVSSAFVKGDHRIDSAFTIYYFSINCGSFLSMLLCPFIKSIFGWTPSLWVSFFGMFLAIVSYLMFINSIKELGSKLDKDKISYKKFIFTLSLTIIVIISSANLLKYLYITNWLLMASFVVILFFLIKILITMKDKEEKIKFAICLLLMFEALTFYILYQQMPTSLNLFAIRNVYHYFLGISLQGESFQAFNPLWIIIAGPLLAKLFSHLGKNGKDFSMPFKFAFAMLFCAIGFIILYYATIFFADTKYMLSPYWLFTTYGFLSIGEILIAGLGLSMMSKFVPKRILGFTIGSWYMVGAIARTIGGYVASWASIPKELTTDPSTSLVLYSSLFFKLGIASLCVAFIMFIIVLILKPYLKDL